MGNIKLCLSIQIYFIAWNMQKCIHSDTPMHMHVLYAYSYNANAMCGTYTVYSLIKTKPRTLLVLSIFILYDEQRVHAYLYIVYN